MKHGKKFTVICLVIVTFGLGMAGSGCFGTKEAAAPSGTVTVTGPVDGTYAFSALTCDGTPTSFLPPGAATMYMTFSGLTGSRIIVYSSGCTATEGHAYTYPDDDEFTVQAVNRVCSASCAGAECTASSTAGTAMGMSYTVSGSTMTVTKTSAGEDGCANGETSVFTLVKQ